MTILEYLKRKNPNGLPIDEAEQLFLLLFCTLDLVPKDVQRPIGKQELITTFTTLANEGWIHSKEGDVVNALSDTYYWQVVIRKLNVDRSFIDRASNYL